MVSISFPINLRHQNRCIISSKVIPEKTRSADGENLSEGVALFSGDKSLSEIAFDGESGLARCGARLIGRNVP